MHRERTSAFNFACFARCCFVFLDGAGRGMLSWLSASSSSSSTAAKTGLGWFARQAEFEKIRFTRQPSQPGAQTRPYRGWLHQGGKFSVLTSSPDRILIRRHRQLEQCLAGMLRKSSISASSQRGGEGEAGTSWGEDKMGRAGGTETRPH